MCCHGYACAACDVHVTLKVSEIKRHVRRYQDTKFERTRKSFGEKKTELMSSLLSHCEGIDV